MERCSKCSTASGFLVKYTNLNETWALCHVCNTAFDDRTFLLNEFMKEDFGGFPVHQIQKDMILARMNRAGGKSPWSKVAF